MAAAEKRLWGVGTLVRGRAGHPWDTGGAGREKENTASASPCQVSLLEEGKMKPSCSPRSGAAGRDGTGGEGRRSPRI